MDLELQNCLACDGEDLREYITTSDMMHRGDESFTFAKCNDCHLVMLTPRVPLDQLSEYYQSFYLPYRGAAAWGKYAYLVERDQRKIDRQRVRTALRYTSLSAANSVLDVGCGKPTFIQALHGATGAQCLGSDFSDHGWAGDADQYSNINLHTGLPSEIVTDGPVDLITMWHYLEHDYQPTETLQQMLAHSHNGTRLIIEVPDHDGSTRQKYGSKWAGYHTPRHTGLYTIDSMTKLLSRSGWKVVDSYRSGTLDPYTLAWMSKMEQSGIDWSASMEPRFWSYVAGMMMYSPRKLQKEGHGFMTVVAEPS